MEHALAALNAAERQGIVRPVFEFDLPSMWAIRNGDDAGMLGTLGRPYAHHEFEAQPSNLVQKGGGLKSTVGEDAHPEPGANGIRDGAQQVTGQRDRRRGPFAAVDPVSHRKLQGPVVRKQDHEMNPVDLVIDANER